MMDFLNFIALFCHPFYLDVDYYFWIFHLLSLMLITFDYSLTYSENAFKRNN